MAKRQKGKRVAAKPGSLRPKQEAFARAYAKGMSGVEAYRLAGYSNAGKNAVRNAFRLTENEGIKARVAELLSKASVRTVATIERLEQELERLALSDTRRLYRDDGSMKSPGEWDDDTAAAVAAVETSEKFKGRGKSRKVAVSTKKVKCHSKREAIADLLKRRDAGRPVVIPALEPVPGSSPKTPLHVNLTVSGRIAELESAFLDAAQRAGESPVSSDDRGQPVDPGTHQGGHL